MSTLYENIMFYCNKKGVTGGKMCVDCGVSKSTLTSLKNGRTQKVSTGNLKKFADYLNVTIDDLLENELPWEVAAVKAELYDQTQKSPTPNGVELTETQKMALDLIKNMDESQLKVFIAGAKSVLGG